MAHVERAAVELIGHRGAAALAPENTLAGIGAGLAAGADGVEVDVRRTADGALVLMHDPEVSRTTNGTGRLDDLSLEAVRSLDAGFHFADDGGHPARRRGIVVPTLEEAVRVVPSGHLLVIEIKGHPWEAGYDPDEPVARAVGAILAAAAARNIVVSSFNPRALQVVRDSAPGFRTAVLTPAAFDLASNLAAAIDGGHEECHVPASILEEPFVAEAHAAGRRVVAWTVDDPERVRAFARWGVDAVICDDPGAARAALSR